MSVNMTLLCIHKMYGSLIYIHSLNNQFKHFIAFNYVYSYICVWPFLNLCVFVLLVVAITRPPEDTTVCKGSDVIISCGINSTDNFFDTIWGFNGSALSKIVNNPFYRAINQTLTIFSINYTTTVYCGVNIRVSPPIILTSGTATVTVVGMY